MYQDDKRVVLTLDAGGTNLVFGAMQGGEFITSPLTLPSHSDNLDLCLETIVKGFKEMLKQVPQKPVAISFAFPGPADYPRGIIGGYLPNFPSFRDGVALGPYLENVFGLPVFINNDGDLFAYGEALSGTLPLINQELEKAGSCKRYNNLMGFTFGTGFGVGIVVNNQLNIGDNSCVEIFCHPHKHLREIICEEGVSIRAIKRVYKEMSGDDVSDLTPFDIFKIAEGEKEGDRQAAVKAFEMFGEVAGEAISIVAQLIDGIVVIGGGIIGAKKYFLPALLKQMRGELSTLSGAKVKRIQMDVYNLDDPQELEKFTIGNSRTIKVPGTDKEVPYDPEKKIGVAFTKLGASEAISKGAYAFALSKLDNQ